VQLLESMDEPALTVALSIAYLNINHGAGKIREVLRLAERVIELAADKPSDVELISVSPLANAMAIRGTARWILGQPGWREDFTQALDTIATVPPVFRSGTFWIVYVMAIPNGVLLPREEAIAGLAEIDSAAGQFGEQIAVELGKAGHGIALTYRGRPEFDKGARLLDDLYEASLQKGYTIPGNLPLLILHVARERGRSGDRDDAIELSRSVIKSYRRSGEVIWLAAALATLVDLLLQRGFDADIREAREAVRMLAALPTEPGVVLNEIWLLQLRARLAQADGDETTYRDYRDRYRQMATDLGFEGHMAWAAAMV
jgi:adenylate cyclase